MQKIKLVYQVDLVGTSQGCYNLSNTENPWELILNSSTENIKLKSYSSLICFINLTYSFSQEKEDSMKILKVFYN